MNKKRSEHKGHGRGGDFLDDYVVKNFKPDAWKIFKAKLVAPQYDQKGKGLLNGIYQD